MRILRQLSLEDVARGTKMSTARLADLEADEYSNFPNIAYAKGFLRSYGKFLNVDLKPYLDAFEGTSTFGLDDYQYLSDKPVGVYRIPRRQQRPKFRRKGLFVTASLLGVCAMVGFMWFLYLTALRLGDLNKLAERQDARLHGSARPGSEPSASPRQLLPTVVTPSPSPEGTPTSSDSMGRDLVAFTLAASSPSAVLSQLSAPAANLPVPPAAADPAGVAGASTLRSMMLKPLLLGSPSNPVNNLLDTSAVLSKASGTDRSLGGPVPSGGGNRFYVHVLDRNSVDIFRTGVPRPPAPAGHSFE